MNTALLVTTAVCVGIPALAAGLIVVTSWAWDGANTRRIQALLDPPEQPAVVDCEDHDEQPSPEEELMLAQVEGYLADQRQQRELQAVDDLDLPPKLKQAIRRRVIAGERLADVYQVNAEREDH